MKDQKELKLMAQTDDLTPAQGRSIELISAAIDKCSHERSMKLTKRKSTGPMLSLLLFVCLQKLTPMFLCGT